MSRCEQCAKLRAIIVELEEQLKIVEHRDLDHDLIRPEGLTATPWRIVRILLRRQEVSRDGIIALVWGSKPEADWPKDPRTVDQHVCRANKVLRRYGCAIKASNGIGYQITAVDRAKLRRLLSRDYVMGIDSECTHAEADRRDTAGAVYPHLVSDAGAAQPTAGAGALPDDARDRRGRAA